ncbi:hypothetical protein [Microbacterium sp.]|uniref:hypothetical protein n=1 Tax=Microbacterium sp. TaxID=51671 RepID=UPI002BB42AE8|nr:hypothetical protein [Microbacterium sp.]HWK76563.1 hypothetical protein [Microbacterium sp.]
MSVEMITMLIGIVSILLALAGAFGWMIHRMDVLENRLEGKLGARIDAGDERLGARIDALDEKLGARIDKVADELVEVKIALARVEGPPRHLITAR